MFKNPVIPSQRGISPRNTTGKHLIIAAIIFIVTVILSMATNFISWDETRLEQTVWGLLLAIGIFLELPFLFVASWLIPNNLANFAKYHLFLDILTPFVAGIFYAGLYYFAVTVIKKFRRRFVDVIKFKKALRKSWSKETSYCPNEWNEKNPALGQCAVSALVANDYFGGKIIWAEVLSSDGQKISHYFNSIDGQEVDLTRSQFPVGTIIPAGVEKKKGFASTRKFMLSNENAKKRYELLKGKVENNLG